MPNPDASQGNGSKNVPNTWPTFFIGEQSVAVLGGGRACKALVDPQNPLNVVSKHMVEYKQQSNRMLGASSYKKLKHEQLSSIQLNIRCCVSGAN